MPLREWSESSRGNSGEDNGENNGENNLVRECLSRGSCEVHGGTGVEQQG
jgi:hypothetical protein